MPKAGGLGNPAIAEAANATATGKVEHPAASVSWVQTVGFAHRPWRYGIRSSLDDPLAHGLHPPERRRDGPVASRLSIPRG
jgi:hypothetical protein